MSVINPDPPRRAASAAQLMLWRHGRVCPLCEVEYPVPSGDRGSSLGKGKEGRTRKPLVGALPCTGRAAVLSETRAGVIK